MLRLFTIAITLILGLLPVNASGITPPPQAFSQCANCHTTAKEGQHRIAPPLVGIVGRKIASVPGFAYSDALKAQEGIWTKAKLDVFIKRPNHAFAKTKMYFRGLPSAEDRATLINWLAVADVPSVIDPHRERRLKKTVRKALLKPERKQQPKTAQQLFRRCKGCHNHTEGAPANIGPNLWGVVGRPVASFPSFNYSDHLKKRGGIWDAERLHKFFTEKKSFGQGSHLAFRKLKLKQDRDLLIAFLGSLSH